MANEYKNKLKKYIEENASLDEKQKTMWDLFTKISLPDEDEAVLEAVIESKENLQLLTNNLHSKIADMKNNNRKIWDVIINHDKKYAELFN
jgi:hypothetical protein